MKPEVGGGWERREGRERQGGRGWRWQRGSGTAQQENGNIPAGPGRHSCHWGCFPLPEAAVQAVWALSPAGEGVLHFSMSHPSLLWGDILC